MKHWILILSALFMGLAGLSGQAPKPNLLFIMADDCTFRDLGVYGGQAYTPNLERLASEGMRFERCFQASPMCSPTRHNIYTGLYPVKSGAYTNHTFAYDDVRSIVHYLRPEGYRVALSGKTHVKPESVFPFEYSRGSKEDSLIDMAAVDAIMKDAAEGGKPFALFACSNEPHAPWTKGEQYRDRYDLDALELRPYMVDTPETREQYRNYLAEVTYFDEEVGRVLALLEANGLAENTLVMVVSEQGNSFPFAKWSCYDSGLQSMMIVRWPGKVEPGSETAAMVEYVDICPTFVEAAGGQPAPVLDGKSFMPVLLGETDRHKDVVYGLQTSRGIYSGPDHYAIRSIRDEKYKLVMNLDSEATFYNSMDTKDWFASWERAAEAGDRHAIATLKRYHKRPALELYDVTEDPYEMNNLAANPEYAEVMASMKSQLEAWMASQGDKGMETEMAGFERMLSGNKQWKQWSKLHGGAEQKKKEEKKKNKKGKKKKKVGSKSEA